MFLIGCIFLLILIAITLAGFYGILASLVSINEFRDAITEYNNCTACPPEVVSDLTSTIAAWFILITLSTLVFQYGIRKIISIFRNANKNKEDRQNEKLTDQLKDITASAKAATPGRKGRYLK